MPISRRQLAVSLLAASHIADRGMIADPATTTAPNPFAETSVGAVRQVWRQRAAEFQSFDIEAVGLPCLLAIVADMSVDEVLVQEILRAGPNTADVLHYGDGCEIVGAVLYGKPGAGLPAAPIGRWLRAAPSPRSRARRPAQQLDLFARAEA